MDRQAPVASILSLLERIPCLCSKRMRRFFLLSSGALWGNLRRPKRVAPKSVDAQRFGQHTFPTGEGEVAERLKAHAWKACWGQPLQGSNPCLSATIYPFQLEFVMKNLFALLAIAGLVMFAAPQVALHKKTQPPSWLQKTMPWKPIRLPLTLPLRLWLWKSPWLLSQWSRKPVRC